MQSQLPIAITMGDAAGIGPEIIVKFLARNTGRKAFVIGDPGVMLRAAERWGDGVGIVFIEKPEMLAAHSGSSIAVLPASRLPDDLPIGAVDARAGQAAYDAILRAVDLAQEGRIAGIVTAPIHKEALAAAGISFPGHTEILADRTGTRNFGMMLANDELRVVLVSIHVALAEAIRLVTQDNVRRAIRLAEQGVRALGIATPRIAVAGLNPHAGEGGLFGREDIEVIAPAVAAMRAEGVEVSGPYAPDTIFMRARNGEFDVVVAQYHDQGLIPVKYLGIEAGVNITVGLPIVRTSVDHGTAFDIAGKGVADARSLEAAFNAALRLAEAAGRQDQGSR